MRILDWRSPGERWLAYSPQIPWPALAVTAAGRLADHLAAQRARRRRPPPSGVFLVSIGNLRLGGTGKTPVVLALARGLHAAGCRGAVLLRGFGSKHGPPLPVAATDRRAADEARWLAAGLETTDWPVWQARRRDRGLACLLESTTPPPDLVLLEDGFQTPRLGRHLDVLIIDDWSVEAGRLVVRAGPTLPCGPYRETARGARRAQVWLLETGALPPCAAGRSGLQEPRLCGFERRHVLAAAPPSGSVTAAAVPRQERWGLLSGLARPERFEAAAVSLLPAAPLLSVRCSDHCPYGRRRVERILAAGRHARVTAWVTTEKDWIKLQPHWPAAAPICLLRQTVCWTGDQALPDLVEERLRRLGGAGVDGLPSSR